MATTSIDLVSLTAAAQRIDAAAGIVTGAVQTNLGRLRFSEHAAGRAHGPAGRQVRLALDRLRADLTGWALAAGELAAALHTGAERYRAAEQHAATTLR
jgi:hypothetical protein